MWKRYLLAIVGYVGTTAVGMLFGLEVDEAVSFAFVVGCAAVIAGERFGWAPTSEEANRPPTLFPREPREPEPGDSPHQDFRSRSPSR